MIELAPSVQAVTARLLGMLDARLPGRLEAFYLVGSVALGDFREGQSDLDFVAVLAAPHDAAILASIHADLARDFPGLDCDGIYLRPGELSKPPEGSGISLRAGRLEPQSGDERHAVTWLLLADAGIALRGRAPDHRWVAADRSAAIAHSRDNLERYWRPWLQHRRQLLSPAGLSLLGNEAIAWGGLGIVRLHATIAEGRVPSKTAAGEYALRAFPAHARLVREALRIRCDPAALPFYGSALTRRRELLAFTEAVLDDRR